MIIFIAPCPYPHRAQEGMRQRVAFIDSVFQHVERVYIEPTDDVPYGAPKKNQINSKLTHMYVKNKALNKDAKIIDLFDRSEFIYVHSLYFAEKILEAYGRYKIITDMHGVVPEEEAWRGNSTYSSYLNQVEKKIVTNSLAIITVSQKMTNFYEEKYVAFKKKIILIPVLNYDYEKPTLKKNKMKKKLSIIYAGGSQKWQNVDLMLRAYKKIEKNISFNLLTFDFEYFYTKLFDLNLHDAVTCQSVSRYELSKFYKEANLGFILRDAILVNTVASPTKLIEYISYGVVPVVSQPEIGDYNSLGYSYVLLSDLINQHLPSDKQLQQMQKNNLKILTIVQMQAKEGIRALTYFLLQHSEAKKILSNLQRIENITQKHIQSFTSQRLNFNKKILISSTKQSFIFIDSVQLVHRSLEIIAHVHQVNKSNENLNIAVVLTGKKNKIYLKPKLEYQLYGINKQNYFYFLYPLNKLSNDSYTLKFILHKDEKYFYCHVRIQCVFELDKKMPSRLINSLEKINYQLKIGNLEDRNRAILQQYRVVLHSKPYRLVLKIFSCYAKMKRIIKRIHSLYLKKI